MVAGSREWPAGELWFVEQEMVKVAPSFVISGRGGRVDRHAIEVAVLRGWPHHEEPADWRVKPHTPPDRVKWHNGRPYDSFAGFERNLRMLDMDIDMVLAFLWGDTPGTKHTISNARSRGIPVRTFTELELRQPVLW